MDLEKFVEYLKKLAKKVGEMQKEKLSTAEIDFKDVDPEVDKLWGVAARIVTSADREIEDFVLKDLLENGYGDLQIHGEEDSSIAKEFKATSDYKLHIDPIDGTLNYVVSNPENQKKLQEKFGVKFGAHKYGVIFGLEKNDEFVAAAVYVTTDDLLYTAIKGKGAYKNGEKITVPQRKYSAEDVIHTNSGTEGMVPNPKDTNDYAAAYIIPAVADGNVVCSFVQGMTPHDDGGPFLIVTEAGGFVSDEKGVPITKIQNSNKRFHISCPSKEYAEELIKKIK